LFAIVVVLAGKALTLCSKEGSPFLLLLVSNKDLFFFKNIFVTQNNSLYTLDEQQENPFVQKQN